MYIEYTFEDAYFADIQFYQDGSNTETITVNISDAGGSAAMRLPITQVDVLIRRLVAMREEHKRMTNLPPLNNGR